MAKRSSGDSFGHKKGSPEFRYTPPTPYKRQEGGTPIYSPYQTKRYKSKWNRYKAGEELSRRESDQVKDSSGNTKAYRFYSDRSNVGYWEVSRGGGPSNKGTFTKIVRYIDQAGNVTSFASSTEEYEFTGFNRINRVILTIQLPYPEQSVNHAISFKVQGDTLVTNLSVTATTLLEPKELYSANFGASIEIEFYANELKDGITSSVDIIAGGGTGTSNVGVGVESSLNTGLYYYSYLERRDHDTDQSELYFYEPSGFRDNSKTIYGTNGSNRYQYQGSVDYPGRNFYKFLAGGGAVTIATASVSGVVNFTIGNTPPLGDWACNCPDYTKKARAVIEGLWPSLQTSSDWTGSEAGADGDCKHIIAAKFLAEEPPDPPTFDSIDPEETDTSILKPWNPKRRQGDDFSANLLW